MWTRIREKEYEKSQIGCRQPYIRTHAARVCIECTPTRVDVLSQHQHAFVIYISEIVHQKFIGHASISGWPATVPYPHQQLFINNHHIILHNSAHKRSSYFKRAPTFSSWVMPPMNCTARLTHIIYVIRYTYTRFSVKQ